MPLSLPDTTIPLLNTLKPKLPSKQHYLPLLTLLKKQPTLLPAAAQWLPFMMLHHLQANSSSCSNTLSEVIRLVRPHAQQRWEEDSHIKMHSFMQENIKEVSSAVLERALLYLDHRPPWAILLSKRSLDQFMSEDWNEAKAEAVKILSVLLRKGWLEREIAAASDSYLEKALTVLPSAKKEHLILAVIFEASLMIHFRGFTECQQLCEKALQTGLDTEDRMMLTLYRIRALANESPICLVHSEHAVMRQVVKVLEQAKTTETKFNAVQLSVLLLKQLKVLKAGLSKSWGEELIRVYISSLSISVKSVAGLLEEAIKLVLSLLAEEDIMKIVSTCLHLCEEFMDNRKKIFVLLSVEPHLSLECLTGFRPKFFSWLISCCGEYKVTNAGVLLQIVLKRLLAETKDVRHWMAAWHQEYLAVLDECSESVLKGILDVVHPSVVKVCPPALRAMTESSKGPQPNRWLARLTLLSGCREKGIAFARSGGYWLDAKTVGLSEEELGQALLSFDRQIVIRALRLILSCPKIKEPMMQFEYAMILDCLTSQAATSYHDFRKELMNFARKLLERMRVVYESYQHKNVPLPEGFQRLLCQLLRHCYRQLHPGCPFEVESTSVELIVLIHRYFGHLQYEIRKGNCLSPVSFLQKNAVDCYSEGHMNVLVEMLQSDFESTRKNVHEILLYFNPDQAWLHKLGMQLITSPIIKQFEAGAHLISLAFTLSDSPAKVPFLERLAVMLADKITVFKGLMASQHRNDIRQGLAHGLVTALTFCLETLEHYNEKCTTQVERLAIQMVEVLSLGIEISSENVAVSVFKEQAESSFKRGVEQIFKSNSLLTSMDQQQEDSQNLFVVSFYLLTKQSGLFFSELGNALARGLRLSQQVVRTMADCLFLGLKRIKHLDSINKLASALEGILKAGMRPGYDKHLMQTLVQEIGNSQFTSYLRRSAGLPFLFTTLCKLISRRQSLREYMLQLFDYSKRADPLIAVHSLNILKRVFQDATLKIAVEEFVEKAVEIAINGFSVEDWAIRNSSLMLFNVLLVRTVNEGGRVSLSDYFMKFPRLREFFLAEIDSFLEGKSHSLFPTIYPINLLLAQLGPPEDSYRPSFKELESFIPKLVRCAGSKNMMGRAMAARALCPFVMRRKVEFVKDLLGEIRDQGWVMSRHNYGHGLVMQVYEIVKSSEGEKETMGQLFNQLSTKAFLLTSRCAPLKQTFLRAVHLILKSNPKAETGPDLQSFLQDNFKALVLEAQTADSPIGTSLYTKRIIKITVRLAPYQHIQHYLALLLQRYLQGEGFKQSTHQHLQVMVSQLVKTGFKPELQLAQLIVKVALQKQASASAFSQCFKGLMELLCNTDQVKGQAWCKPLYQHLIEAFDLQRVALSAIFLKVLSHLQFPISEEYSGLLHRCSFPAVHSELRVQVLESCLQTSESLLGTLPLQIAWHNLLTDQIPWVRDLAGSLVARHSKTPHLAHQKMTVLFLSMARDETLTELLKVGQSAVRLRNHNEKRIFSYDKCNRSRSDFLVWTQVQKELKKRGLSTKLELSGEVEKVLAGVSKEHESEILWRDQYTFECCFKACSGGSVSLEPALQQ